MNVCYISQLKVSKTVTRQSLLGPLFWKQCGEGSQIGNRKVISWVSITHKKQQRWDDPKMLLGSFSAFWASNISFPSSNRNIDANNFQNLQKQLGSSIESWVSAQWKSISSFCSLVAYWGVLESWSPYSWLQPPCPSKESLPPFCPFSSLMYSR